MYIKELEKALDKVNIVVDVKGNVYNFIQTVQYNYPDICGINICNKKDGEVFISIKDLIADDYKLYKIEQLGNGMESIEIKLPSENSGDNEKEILLHEIKLIDEEIDSLTKEKEELNKRLDEITEIKEPNKKERLLNYLDNTDPKAIVQYMRDQINDIVESEDIELEYLDDYCEESLLVKNIMFTIPIN